MSANRRKPVVIVLAVVALVVGGVFLMDRVRQFLHEKKLIGAWQGVAVRPPKGDWRDEKSKHPVYEFRDDGTVQDFGPDGKAGGPPWKFRVEGDRVTMTRGDEFFAFTWRISGDGQMVISDGVTIRGPEASRKVAAWREIKLKRFEANGERH